MKTNSISQLATLLERAQSGIYTGNVSDPDVEKADRQRLVDDIMRVFYAEAESVRKVGKFSIWNQTGDDPQRPVIGGVHYEQGLAVASDGSILVVIKDEHRDDWNDTTRAKNGDKIDNKYPDWRRCIFGAFSDESHTVPADLLDEAERALRADMSATGIRKKKAVIRIAIGQREDGTPRYTQLRLDHLRKAQAFCAAYNFPFSLHLRTDMHAPEKSMVRFGAIDVLENTMVIMPCTYEIPDGKDFIITL